MFKFDLYWAPEGRKIATVVAKSAWEAKRKAPPPYRKYLGEIWVDLGRTGNGEEPAKLCPKHGGGK